MEDIDKVILKLEFELAKTTADVNKLVEKMSKFNFSGGKSKSHSRYVTKNYCKWFLLSLLL